MVIAFLLDAATYQKYPSIPVQVSLNTKPERVELVSASGQRRALPTEYAEGGLQIRLPVQSADDCPKSKIGPAYIQIEER